MSKAVSIIIMLAALTTVMISARWGQSDALPKPLSTEDEIRELKRRADKLESERADLVARADATEVALHKAQKTVNERMDKAVKQARLDAVPVGSIIPFFGTGDTPPEGYVWADGTKPSPEWAKGNFGENVPDLRGRFLRGASKDEKIAALAGSDSIPKHATNSDGKHAHTFNDSDRPLKGFTGGIALDLKVGWTNPGKFSVLNPFGHNREGEDFIVTDGDNNRNEKDRGKGQHRHILDGTGKATGAGMITTNANEGDHSHNIEAINFTPSYVAVRYIIRVR